MSDQRSDNREPITLPTRRADRPVTLVHRIEYGLAAILIVLFRVIGVRASSFIAGKFMRLLGPLLRSVHKRATTNLRYVFPDMPQRDINRVSRDVWENLGRTAAEFAHLEKYSASATSSRVTVEGRAHLDAIVKNGKPVIFVSGHFANWEVGSIVLHDAGVDYGLIYRAANNPLVDEFIINKRGDVMSRRQIPKGKRGGRQLMESLRAGRSIALLVDQKLNDGIRVPFIGRDAMTAPAPARLALKFGAPIIPISIERLENATFRVEIKPPLAFDPTGDTAEDTRALTIKINEAIADDIRARPGQWLWLHRRWGKNIHIDAASSPHAPS